MTMSGRRVSVVLAGVLLMALMMAVSGVAAAQGGDVCVSNKGETKVQKGESSCNSDSTSHAVATNDSSTSAVGGCNTTAHNGENMGC